MAILAFHNIEDRFSIGINNYKPNKLRLLCEYLKGVGYVFGSISDNLASPDKEASLSFTFDDGYKSFIETAYPVLKEYSIPATVFIPSAMIGRKNSWEYSSFLTPREHLSATNIRRLSEEGVEIGSHGHSHIALTTLSDRFLRLELEKSKRILEDLTGQPINYISYPFGRVNKKVETAALEVGYERGFSLARIPSGGSGFSIRRSAVYAWDSPYSVLKKTGGGAGAAMERFKEHIINSYSGGTILLNKLRGRNLPARD